MRSAHGWSSTSADTRTGYSRSIRTVERPRTVRAVLQQAAGQRGLRSGPDPSTHTRCTVGGMIGNDACGACGPGYSRTSDSVVGLDLLTAPGERVLAGYDSSGSLIVVSGDELPSRLRTLMSAH